MKIQWLGHSCFKLEESTGTTVVADPYDTKTLEQPLQNTSCDVVTISHEHHDHCSTDSILGNPVIIKELGSWEINGVGITSLYSYHDAVEGKKRGDNLIFKYRMDGVDLCHLGDIGEECSVRLSETIGTVNVLFVPIGGKFTIDAEQAKEYVDFLMPDIVIPMHFRTDKSAANIEKIDNFLELFDEEQLVYIDGQTIELDRANFEGDCTKVIIFGKNIF